MQYWVYILIVAMVGLNSCEKGCSRCNSNTICVACTKGTDTLRTCYPAAGVADSIKKYTDLGYHCTQYSGVQYSIKVCQQDSLVVELQREGYGCTKEN